MCQLSSRPRRSPPILLGILLTLLAACSKDDRNESPRSEGTTQKETTGRPQVTVKIDELSMDALARREMLVDGPSTEACLDVVVTAKFEGAPAEGGEVTFSIKGLNDSSQSKDGELGRIEPEVATADEMGLASAKYCRGSVEGIITIEASSNGLSTNSTELAITKKPEILLTFDHADLSAQSLQPGAGKASEDKQSLQEVRLNLIDSGPFDCTHLYYKLTRSGVAYAGQKLDFASQVDYPKGSKLATKLAAGESDTELNTGKKYAIFSGETDGKGLVKVPVCAGVGLGSLQITATYIIGEGTILRAQSPVVRITSGLTTYVNMSLSFDPENARTLMGYFNTNSEYSLTTRVKLGARLNAEAIADYPITATAESGQVTLVSAGIMDGKGEAVFNVAALHMVDNYAYPIVDFGSHVDAQTRCSPQDLGAYASEKGLVDVKYKDLAKNWRSTVVYMIRGQESYHDANRNGIYDMGGDGFWDRNQNGIYDSGDILTYDAGQDGFDPEGEWFIDLPTPFVDVDENGEFDRDIDLLVGDDYVAANGRRDADALLWKSEVYPIFMGTSFFSLTNNRIRADYPAVDTSVTLSYGTHLIFGNVDLNSLTLWGNASAQIAQAYKPFVFFAHDICGTGLPGGSELLWNVRVLDLPEFGDRTPLTHVFHQPHDAVLEPARRLLRDAGGTGEGGSKAVINFNAIDHPSAVDGYPVLFYVEVPSCTNKCKGDTSTPDNVICDGMSGEVILSVKPLPKVADPLPYKDNLVVPFSFGGVGSCTCNTGAHREGDTCAADS